MGQHFQFVRCFNSCVSSRLCAVTFHSPTKPYFLSLPRYAHRVANAPKYSVDSHYVCRQNIVRHIGNLCPTICLGFSCFSCLTKNLFLRNASCFFAYRRSECFKIGKLSLYPDRTTSEWRRKRKLARWIILRRDMSEIRSPCVSIVGLS